MIKYEKATLDRFLALGVELIDYNSASSGLESVSDSGPDYSFL